MRAVPLVSIIIPVYNSKAFLEETLHSALDQSWPNIEIVLVDDGSTDASVDVAEQMNNKTIRIFQQENKGASAARNRGLAEARGEYIQFLDADDLLSPDKIAEQADALLRQPGKVALCSTVHFFNGDDPLASVPSPYEEGFLSDDDDPAHFLVNLLGGYTPHESMVQPNAWLTPRSVIDLAGGWDETLSVNDDGEFFCRVLLRSGGIIKTAGRNYYRKYTGSCINRSSVTDQAGMASLFRSYQLKMNYLAAYADQPAVNYAFYKLYFELLTKAYPGYPALYGQVREELSKIPAFPIEFIFGGRAINFIANQLSWKLARRLQLLVSRSS